MRYLSLNLLAVLFFFWFGIAQVNAQGSPPPPKVAGNGQWGVVENGKFKSERLGLILSIPSEFTVISTVEADVLASAGADMIKQGTASAKRIDEAIENTKKLIVIAEKPLGSPRNASFEIVAAKQQIGVTAKMSLAANAMVLKGSPYSLKKSLGSLKIGSNSFETAEFEGMFGDTLLKLRMYIVMHKGYSIVTAVTYFTDDQRLSKEKILSTLTLER